MSSPASAQCASVFPSTSSSLPDTAERQRAPDCVLPARIVTSRSRRLPPCVRQNIRPCSYPVSPLLHALPVNSASRHSTPSPPPPSLSGTLAAQYRWAKSARPAAPRCRRCPASRSCNAASSRFLFRRELSPNSPAHGHGILAAASHAYSARRVWESPATRA